MLAIGNNIQPYPPKHCLTPKKISLNLKLINRTSESLTLELPEPIKSHNCEEYDLATPFYIVYYKHITDNEDITCDNNSCLSKITVDRLFHLKNLNPFSNYMFYVQISNYYDNITYFTPDLFVKPDIFKTKAKGENLIIFCSVFWWFSFKYQLFFNSTTACAKSYSFRFIADSSRGWMAHTVFGRRWWHGYTVWNLLDNPRISAKWKSQKSVLCFSNLKQTIYIYFSNIHRMVSAESKDYPISNSTQPSVMRTPLTKLIPSQEYRIWVETHSNNSDEYSKSEIVFFKTYPEPNNITLNFNSPYEIRISWTPYIEIQINRYVTLVFFQNQLIVMKYYLADLPLNSPK